MLDNPYLDTSISLVLVYAVLNVLVSVLLEAGNKRTKERGVFLQKDIYQLLVNPLNRDTDMASIRIPSSIDSVDGFGLDRFKRIAEAKATTISFRPCSNLPSQFH